MDEPAQRHGLGMYSTFKELEVHLGSPHFKVSGPLVRFGRYRHLCAGDRYRRYSSRISSATPVLWVESCLPLLTGMSESYTWLTSGTSTRYPPPLAQKKRLSNKKYFFG